MDETSVFSMNPAEVSVDRGDAAACGAVGTASTT